MQTIQRSHARGRLARWSSSYEFISPDPIRTQGRSWCAAQLGKRHNVDRGLWILNGRDMIDVLLKQGAGLDSPRGVCPGTAIGFCKSMKEKPENEEMLYVICRYRKIAT